MYFKGRQVNPNVWEPCNVVDSNGATHELIRPKSLKLVLVAVQMKFEHLRILTEAKMGGNLVCKGQVDEAREIELYEMRMTCLRKTNLE